MRFNFLSALLIVSCFAQLCYSQTKWATQGKYLTKDGKPIYLSGVNYIVSDGWMINLPNLSKESMDADMAAMESIGVNHIRFFPLWPLVQPEIDKFDEAVLKKLDAMISSAYQHNISMQIAPITGFMSGAVLLPPWANGDVFKDQKIIDGQKLLSKTIATRYRSNPAVLGYDFGNELNVLVGRMERKFKKDYTPDEIFAWMKHIYPSFKTDAPDQLVTNGIGTGYNNLFDIRNIAQTVDYLSPHSYAYFHGTSSLDPWYGQRTTFSANFIASWCEMVGKPVVIQEIGCSEAWLPPSKIGAYLRLNYLSTWADGAAGFLWWASHDVNSSLRVKSKDMDLNLSSPSFQQGMFGKLEYSLGLLNCDNTPKEYATTFTESVKTVNGLGLGWKDELPVCYIIVPETGSFDNLMHKYITAYSLAKQAHFDVKLCYDGTPIPSDASAVIIPGYKLKVKGKELVKQYLENGGKVFQSYENDFGTSISANTDTIVKSSSLVALDQFGTLDIFQRIPVTSPVTFKKTNYTAPAEPLMAYTSKFRQYSPVKGDGVFFVQPIGKGKYYYFAGNVEAALSSVYNPWVETCFEHLYSTVKPRASVEVDNKFVEFYVKSDGPKKMMLLLNHSEKYQNVTVSSVKPIKMVNSETQQQIGAGKEITLLLKPAEVVIANFE